MRLALTPSARACTGRGRRDRGGPRRRASRAGGAERARRGPIRAARAAPSVACARTTPPAARLPVNTTLWNSPRSGSKAPLVKGTGCGMLLEPLAHPLDVAIDERAGFAEVALHGKRDDHRAPCAADAQRQPTRTRMSSHLNRAIELFDARTLQCLPPTSAATDFPPRASRRWPEQPTEADTQHAAFRGRLQT